ncbi:hypothetical protein B1209_26520 [Raoultella planticola]|nr:hypothetical protein CRT62_26220 [Raoultella planticola]ATM14920.1 hypothetical protein CRN15_08625 [Raoultella planticola]AUV55743.1 hypothetical protein B1209_26520 [Raoultella planticola]OZP70954.1 hypothetical protein CIG23_26105 [Raoultella planticola]PHH25136.1 hypothetical protein CRX55_14325 [Raoultella planticola]
MTGTKFRLKGVDVKGFIVITPVNYRALDFIFTKDKILEKMTNLYIDESVHKKRFNSVFSAHNEIVKINI